MKRFIFFIILLTGMTVIMISCSNAEAPPTQSQNLTKEDVVSAKAVSSSAQTEENTTGYEIGDKAADFRLINTDGKMVSLADFKDAKGFIVTFTCNTCPYAQGYENRLIALHEKYAPNGYPVIAINPNDPEITPGDSYEEMKSRAKNKKYPFVYLFDADQNVFPKFGATRTPHIFLLDKSLIVRYIGAIDDNPQDPDQVKVKYVENAIAAIESGQEPDPSTTKAIGCAIKVKKS